MIGCVRSVVQATRAEGGCPRTSNGLGRTAWLWPLLTVTGVLACLGLQLWNPRLSLAQQEPVCAQLVSYEDVTGDGRPDIARLKCQLTPGSDDQAIVLDGQHAITWETPWDEVVDFEHDTWVLDHGADGTAQLIMVFRREGSRLTAELYDDQDGDGEVRYQLLGDELAITETDGWTVQVLAEGGWGQGPDVNFNLTLSVDGNVEAMFGSNHYLWLLETDGAIDFVIQVRDIDSDGRPDYELRRQHIPALQEAVGQGFHLMVNWADSEPRPDGPRFWPYLSSALKASGSRVPKPARYVPPIQVDWAAGKIAVVGEFVASRAGEDNCFIYGTGSLEPDMVADAGFENPFCFYDLAGDGDRVPELQIRTEYWPAGDFHFFGRLFPSPIEWVRYSWDQDNDGAWDYGLGLVGRHEIQSTITAGDYVIRSIPYNGYPEWITEREWDAAVFVDTEAREYRSSEGIYAAQVPLPVIYLYVTGLTNELPQVDLAEMTPGGLRVEYAPDLGAPPRLYLSPVDGRLHLLDSVEGLWNMDESRTERYRDLDGDGYVNEWCYIVDDQEVQRLIAMLGYWILAEPGRLSVVSRDLPVAPFDVSPPRTTTEWQVLTRELTINQRQWQPGEYGAALEGLSSLATSIEGATMRDFRVGSGGFRFVLELAQGFRVTTDAQSLGSLLDGPGAYVVGVKAGQWFAQPLTPASVHARALRVEGPGALVRELEWTTVQMEVGNEGLEDARDFALCTVLQGPGGQTEVLTTTVALIAGEGHETVRWDWAPPEAGTWQAHAEVGCEPDQERGQPRSELPAITIDVEPRPGVSLEWLLPLGGNVPLTIGVLFGAMALLATGVATLWLVDLSSQRPSSGRTGQPEWHLHRQDE